MARFKPVRGKKGIPPKKANAIGCMIVLGLIFLLMFWMIYYTVSQGR
jgi:hypothetical protein